VTLLMLQALLALALISPLALALRRSSRSTEVRAAALALYRAQLDELTRDAANGLMPTMEYQAARLEIERRLLTADQMHEAPQTGNAKPLLIAALILVPLAGFALYLPGGAPNVPSEPHASWMATNAPQYALLDKLITQLRAHLATVDPHSANASEGEAYLGQALSERADAITPEALALFRQSLASAPPGAPWISIDQQFLGEAGQTQ
jgi:cytochrome c-type biogenesis protein CcmH